MNARSKHLAQSLPGRQTGRNRGGLSNVLFKPMTLFALMAIGLFSFGAFFVLGGFADDLRKTPPGQATPRSVSAVGYKALQDYMNQVGYIAHETRDDRDYYARQSQLVIYTPSRTYSRLSSTLEKNTNEIRLVVLPKWSVRQFIPQENEQGSTDWARKNGEDGLSGLGEFNYLFEDIPVIRRVDDISQNIDVKFTMNFQRNLPDLSNLDVEALQYFDLDTRWSERQAELMRIRMEEIEEFRKQRAEERGEDYVPLSEKEEAETEEDEGKKNEEEVSEPNPLPDYTVLMRIDEKPVLIRLENSQTYILSEPDLINTMAFQTQTGARFALGVIDEVLVASEAELYHADFDVSLHGIENGRNLIKLMVTPPFLAATLCLLLAGGLVAWQGFNRFGDPARVRPDYAQGPVSLAETAAEFMDVANRTHKTGENYAALIRRQVVDELGFKGRTEAATDKLLDGREKRRALSPTYAELKTKISTATPQSYGQYAKALTVWREKMIDTGTLQEDPTS